MQVCGASGTDTVSPGERYRLQNYPLIQKKRLSIKAFLVPDLIPQFIQRFFTEFPALMGQGKLRSEEAVTEGFEGAAQAIANMLKSGSDSVGKPVIIVAKE